jgi:hypothetical protein
MKWLVLADFHTNFPALDAVPRAASNMPVRAVSVGQRCLLADTIHRAPRGKAATMRADDRFATRADTVEATPEPFRGALLQRLSARDSIRLLAFNPSYTSQGVRSPATLLTLTDRRWLLVADDEEGATDVVECDFDDTLLVELTEILLYGQLKIDFVAGGTVGACIIEFNTVTDKLYREAAHHILRGIEGGTAAAPSEEPAAVAVIETWPIMFRSAVQSTLPEGSDPVAAVQWEAVYGGFRRELSPAAALLATDRELLLISEERAWVRGPRQAKYGHIATYFPLVRLASFGLRRHERFSILDLEMHASHGGETLHILFPPEREQDVAQVVECASR